MCKSGTILAGLFLLSMMAVGQAPIFNERADTSRSPQLFRPVTAILGAFPPELALLKAQLQRSHDTVIQHILFTEGLLEGKQVVLAQTGIGKVNAAVATTLVIEHFRPQRLLFSGIAGGLNPMLLPGDLVIGARVAHHDYGTQTPDSILRRPTRNPFTMQENPIYFVSDSNLVRAALEASKHVKFEPVGSRLPKVISGVVVTGDVFVASDQATKALHTSMQGDATEMEGAAVAQVCWQQRTPFVVIRSLSDDAGNNASALVRNFYEIAAHNAASLVVALVKQLPDRGKLD